MSLLLLSSLLFLAVLTVILFALGQKQVAIVCSVFVIILLLGNMAFYIAIART